jgi:hypothetical protein
MTEPSCAPPHPHATLCFRLLPTARDALFQTSSQLRKFDAQASRPSLTIRRVGVGGLFQSKQQLPADSICSVWHVGGVRLHHFDGVVDQPTAGSGVGGALLWRAGLLCRTDRDAGLRMGLNVVSPSP